MLSSIRKPTAVVAAVGTLGLGGAAFAGATDSTGSARTSSSRTDFRPARETLSSAVAAKVKAAALEKVPGATVLRPRPAGPTTPPITPTSGRPAGPCGWCS